MSLTKRESANSSLVALMRDSFVEHALSSGFVRLGTVTKFFQGDRTQAQEIVKKHAGKSMLEAPRTKIARAVRVGPAGPTSSRAYVSLVTFFAPKKVTYPLTAPPFSPEKGGKKSAPKK